MLTATLVTAALAVSIVACVAPEEDCTGLAISTIDTAQQKILCQRLCADQGSGILAALIRAGQS